MIADILSRIAPKVLGLCFLLSCSLAHGFDLDQLSTQLAATPVVHGSFVQEKQLRGLPQPLRSTGRFVLDRSHGLLWLLETPIKQDYRIVQGGIDQRTGEGWSAIRQQAGLAQQSRLFIAILQGDRTALERDFSLELNGSTQAWQLALTPRSGLLKQIFSTIRIGGARYVERIELQELQGDATVLRLSGSTDALPLSPQEKNDLGS